RAGLRIVVEQGKVGALRHEHDSLETEFPCSLQELVQAESRLARPDARITDRMQSRFHHGGAGFQRAVGYSGSKATPIQVTLSREPRSSAVWTRCSDHNCGSGNCLGPLRRSSSVT